MIADIHSHIIPNIDDGAKSTAEAIKILQLMAQDGITAVAATPHFYADVCAEPELHLAAVLKELDLLREALPANMPKIVLGHEVKYFRGICRSENIDLLRMGKSDRILLELPYGNFGGNVADEIVELSLNTGLMPILAHIERHTAADGFDAVMDTVADGFCLGQIGCDSLVDPRRRKSALRLIDAGYASFIATDAHNSTTRPPLMSAALQTVEQKLGTAAAQALIDNANALIEVM